MNDREKKTSESEAQVQAHIRDMASYVGSDDAKYAHDVAERILLSMYNHGFDDGFEVGCARALALEKEILDHRARIEKLERPEPVYPSRFGYHRTR